MAKRGNWASGFFTAKELESFHRVVEADLDRRKLAYELGEGVVHVERAGQKRSWGLTNVAQACHALPAKEWKGRIKFHFDSLIEVEDGEAELAAKTKDFASVAKLLKVRLHSPEWLESTDPKKTVSMQPASGVVAVLVYDLPKAVIGVSASEVRAWRKRAPELFELGIANVEAEGLHKTVKVDLDNGLAGIGLQDESFFTATHALFAGRYLKTTPERGTLVIMPTRHTALFHPIASPKSEQAIRPMLEMASGFYEEGPGAVTPFLYHLIDGKLSVIEMELTKRDVKLHYPKSLVRALA